MINRLLTPFVRSRLVTVIAVILALSHLLAAYGVPVSTRQRVSSSELAERRELNRALAEIANGRYQDGRAILLTLFNNSFLDSLNPLGSIARLIVADSYYREAGYRNINEAER